MKSRISEHLGHAEIILPSLVADGLAGNDRAKVRMSALQAAAQHACNPTSKRVDLSAECRAAGVDEVAVQSLVGDAQQVAGGAIAAPQLSKAIDALLDDVRMMIRAASVGDVSAGRSALLFVGPRIRNLPRPSKSSLILAFGRSVLPDLGARA